MLVQYLANELDTVKDCLLYERNMSSDRRFALQMKMEEFEFLVNLPDNLYKLEIKDTKPVGPPIEKNIYQAVVEGKA